jgi:hypothetical protein
MYISIKTNKIGIDFTKEVQNCMAQVAHACNPGYLGNWDQEDYGSRWAW